MMMNQALRRPEIDTVREYTMDELKRTIILMNMMSQVKTAGRRCGRSLVRLKCTVRAGTRVYIIFKRAAHNDVQHLFCFQRGELLHVRSPVSLCVWLCHDHTRGI